MQPLDSKIVIVGPPRASGEFGIPPVSPASPAPPPISVAGAGSVGAGSDIAMNVPGSIETPMNRAVTHMTAITITNTNTKANGNGIQMTGLRSSPVQHSRPSPQPNTSVPLLNTAFAAASITGGNGTGNWSPPAAAAAAHGPAASTLIAIDSGDDEWDALISEAAGSGAGDGEVAGGAADTGPGKPRNSSALVASSTTDVGLDVSERDIPLLDEFMSRLWFPLRLFGTRPWSESHKTLSTVYSVFVLVLIFWALIVSLVESQNGKFFSLYGLIGLSIFYPTFPLVAIFIRWFWQPARTNLLIASLNLSDRRELLSWCQIYINACVVLGLILGGYNTISTAILGSSQEMYVYMVIAYTGNPFYFGVCFMSLATFLCVTKLMTLSVRAVSRALAATATAPAAGMSATTAEQFLLSYHRLRGLLRATCREWEWPLSYVLVACLAVFVGFTINLIVHQNVENFSYNIIWCVVFFAVLGVLLWQMAAVSNAGEHLRFVADAIHVRSTVYGHHAFTVHDPHHTSTFAGAAAPASGVGTTASAVAGASPIFNGGGVSPRTANAATDAHAHSLHRMAVHARVYQHLCNCPIVYRLLSVEITKGLLVRSFYLMATVTFSASRLITGSSS